jgi:hypothetical protein
MTKRSVIVAFCVALAVVLAAFALVGPTGDADVRETDALVPPAGELAVFGLAVGLVFALTFLVTHLIQRGRRRRSRTVGPKEANPPLRPQTRKNR